MDIKQRTIPFSQTETDLLIDIVKRFKDPLSTVRPKIRVWHKIAEEFNSLSDDQYRDVTMLMNRYKNIRHRKGTYSDNPDENIFILDVLKKDGDNEGLL